MNQRVAVLTYDHAALFELGCAVEIFGLPRPEFRHWYQCDVVSFAPGPHEVTGGITINVRQINSLKEYDTLVVPSWPIDQLEPEATDH